MEYSIGIIISGIQDEFTKLLCRGAMRSAEKNNLNLVIVPGKYLDRPVDCDMLRYEYQYNNLLRCITPGSLDGLIIAANCVCCYAGAPGLEKLLKLYDGIPSVLAATRYEDYSSVNFDNKTGVTEAMTYMIEQLGFTKIGMVCAAIGTSDADERMEAYRETMAAHLLPVENRFIIDIKQNYDNYDMIRNYLDANPDIDGIVCENDVVAKSIYKVMKERNLVPGKDIAVLGFDNTEWAANVFPGLSSVMADPSIMGERCVELLYAKLNGDDYDDNIKIPTKFIHRESIKYSEREEAETSIKISPEASFESIFYRAINEKDDTLTKRIFDTFLATVNNASDFITGKIDSLSENLLDELYSVDNLKYGDIGRYSLYIKNIKEYYSSQFSDLQVKQRLFEMESLINTKLLLAMSGYMDVQRNDHERTVFSMKDFVRSSVEFNNGKDESYATMLQYLDWLWINQAIVYLFKEPMVVETTADFVMPGEMLMKSKKLFNTPFAVEKDKQLISTKELFKPELFEKEWRFSTVILPLYFNEIFYGFIWCDMGIPLFSEGDFVVAQLGSATRSIELLRRFDNLSRIDRLTGLLNRRGFDEDARDLFEKSKKVGNSMIFMYIDMNNLKLINDRFGHENGDFALKNIGSVLDSFFKGRGVVGRIGGDEFAAITSIRPGTDVKEFESMIYREFDAFNAGCTKPYFVTVSIGSYLFAPGDSLSFDDALKHADKVMYLAKKNKKEVLK